MKKLLFSSFLFCLLITASNASAEDCKKIGIPEAKLFEAISTSDLLKLKTLIAKVDLNQTYSDEDFNCFLPLQYAIFFESNNNAPIASRLKVIEALIKGGAKSSGAGLAPYYWPGNESETIELLELLRKSSYDPTLVYPEIYHLRDRSTHLNSTLLLKWSSYGNSPQVLSYLVNLGADVNADLLSYTPLNQAVVRCQTNRDDSHIDPIPTIRMLVSLGANLNNPKDLALWWAIEYACIENAKVLIDSGSDVSILKEKFPNIISKYLWFAFEQRLTGRINEAKIFSDIKFLLELGLEVSGKNDQTLEIASRRYTIPGLIPLLISYGADPNQLYIDELGYEHSPLLSAAKSGKVDNIRELLKAHAQVDRKISRGYQISGVTALHIATGKKDVPSAKALLDGGADVNSLSDSGFTPFSISLGSCGNGYSPMDIINLLLSRGANPTLGNALQRAIDMHCSSELIKMIVAAGG